MGKLLTADMLDSGLFPRLWHAVQPVGAWHGMCM